MKLQHHYKDSLPEYFYSIQPPTQVAEPKLLVFNDALATSLGMEAESLRNNPSLFAGNETSPGAIPIAQAYSGHQFGYFTRLGDGRATLLGEWKDPAGTLWDVQLKGSGRTPYSRGGDGRAAIGPMLREYLISEAMAGLGIPTTRSLAVAATGDIVYRETPLPGAVLTRISRAHIRTGTFQYAMEVGGNAAVKALADYVIKRLYPALLDAEAPYLELVKTVSKAQAALIAQWMGVGFIHGVMNTDNMSIAGETIDYGPCAFMDEYHPGAVFSSIDRNGRYAYGNQPKIAQWNLARFAETLIGVVEEAGEGNLSSLEQIVAGFTDEYQAAYRRVMAQKIGIAEATEDDDALITELLQWMRDHKADFTNTFVALTRGETPDGLEEWQERRMARITTAEEATAMMQRANPVIIPRNHLVENALAEAADGDLARFMEMTELYKNPYNYDANIPEPYTLPMPEEQSRGYRTYCGT